MKECCRIEEVKELTACLFEINIFDLEHCFVGRCDLALIDRCHDRIVANDVVHERMGRKGNALHLRIGEQMQHHIVEDARRVFEIVNVLQDLGPEEFVPRRSIEFEQTLGLEFHEERRTLFGHFSG